MLLTWRATVASESTSAAAMSPFVAPRPMGRAISPSRGGIPLTAPERGRPTPSARELGGDQRERSLEAGPLGELPRTHKLPHGRLALAQAPQELPREQPSTAARSRLFAHLGIPPHGRSLAARLRRSPASKLSERASVSATARRDSRRRGQARCQSGGIAARASRSATSCSPRMSASHDRQSAMKIGSPSSRSPGSRGTAPRAQPRPHLGRERGPPRWPRSGAPAAFALRSWSPPVEAAGPRWRVRPVDPTATSPACASSRRRPPAQAPTDASGPRSARAPQTPADTCGGARTRCAGSAYCTRARTRRCRAPPARRPLRHRRRGQHRRSACRSGMPG